MIVVSPCEPSHDRSAVYQDRAESLSIGSPRLKWATYPDEAARSLFIKRLPWLAALIFVYLGASGVISSFEEALAAEIVLAAFIPLLMGSGGSVGAQSGTPIVRALAVGDLEGRQWVKALKKELVVGVVLGLALGVLAAAVAHLPGGFDIAIVVGASMLLIVVTRLPVPRPVEGTGRPRRRSPQAPRLPTATP